jgi:prepilin-type N-terminal cleavage/methylation domain-containing protein
MRRKCNPRAGFTLAEVLVALVVAAMLAAVLTRYVAGTRLNAAQVRERVELWTLTQSLLDGLPSASIPRSTSGRSGDYSWRVEVAPVEIDAVARIKAPTPPAAPLNMPTNLSSWLADDPTPNAATPAVVAWVPYRVTVRVGAPSGRQYAADTIRIARPRADTR